MGILVLCVIMTRNWIPLAVLGAGLFGCAHGLTYAALLIVLTGIFALLPFNESVSRTSLGYRPAAAEEWKAISGPWNSVIAAIGQTLGQKAVERFLSVRLFVSDDRFPNAFALGRNTVCVTKGLLSLAPSVEVAGVLAHEAGHIYYGDAGRLAVYLTANRLGGASYNILDYFVRMLEWISRALMQAGRQFAGPGGAIGAIIGLIMSLTVFVCNLVIMAIAFISRIVMEIILRAVGRSEEFRADLFARNIGFGQHLAHFLKKIEVLDTAPKDILTVLYRPHPPTAERIDRLIRDVF